MKLDPDSTPSVRQVHFERTFLIFLQQFLQKCLSTYWSCPHESSNNAISNKLTLVYSPQTILFSVIELLINIDGRRVGESFKGLREKANKVLKLKKKCKQNTFFIVRRFFYRLKVEIQFFIKADLAFFFIEKRSNRQNVVSAFRVVKNETFMTAKTHLKCIAFFTHLFLACGGERRKNEMISDKIDGYFSLLLLKRWIYDRLFFAS